MSVCTEALLNKLMQFLDSDAGYVAIGTGTAPSAIDTLLDKEQSRKATTSFMDGLTLIKEGYWDETEQNEVALTNVGLFGDGATSIVNTGELFVGGAINVSKNATESLTISVEISFEAVNE